MDTIGERILKARCYKNLSQTELARKINISNSALSRYENGTREPKLFILKKIAEVLNVSTDYLIGITHIRRCNMDGDKNIEDILEDAKYHY